MPLPILPVVSALAAGGTLVPHAGGGMIVTSASGYVAGTYLSTTAIGGIVTTVSASLGAGALCITGAAGSIIGGAGLFGTTVGATGITGFLMSVGILPATPIWIPIVIGLSLMVGAILLGYGGYRFYKLKRKIRTTCSGEEAEFSDAEAKFLERVLKRFGKRFPDQGLA
jgi:predicted alpha/beta hydrolase